MLGVRLSDAVELKGRFLGLPKSSSRHASTLGTGLRDLLPVEDKKSLLRWCVTEKHTVDQVAATVFDDFVRYGPPFFSFFKSEDSLINFLDGRNRSQDENGTLAILNALAHRDAEAVVALADYARVAETQSPPISDQSWKFVRAFVEHFGLGKSLVRG